MNVAQFLYINNLILQHLNLCLFFFHTKKWRYNNNNNNIIIIFTLGSKDPEG